MKIILRILIILVAVVAISGAAGLVIKATDPGPAAASAKQVSTSQNNGKVLNREQPSQGGSSQAKQGGSSAFSLKTTTENLGKMALIVLGGWSIEKMTKNKRRQKYVPFKSFYGADAKIERYLKGTTFLPRPKYDLISKTDG